MTALTKNSATLGPAALMASLFTLPLIYRYFQYRSKKSKMKDDPPLPPLCSSSLLETVDAMTNGGCKDFVIENFERHGSVYRLRIPIPGVPMVAVLACPQTARAVYQDSSTVKPWLLYRLVEILCGNRNIVSLEGRPGDSYDHRRKALNVAFDCKNIQRMKDIVLQVTEDWIVRNQLSSLTKDSSVSIDIGLEMIKITITVICRAAFEYNPTEEEKEALLEEIKLGWKEFSLKSAFNPLRQFATWMLPERRRAFRSLAFLQEFAKKLMDNYRSSYRSNTNSTTTTVVKCILKNPNYESDSERYADVIMMLFAGHDTTGFTLALNLLELAKNPKEQQRLREELLAADGSGEETTPYLKHVVKETMRLHPAVPVTGFKQLGRDFVTESSPQFLLPKGSILFMGQAAITRDPLVFKNPNHFQPSRWEKDNATDQQKQACFPFSLGKRNCVGQALAVAELYTALARLIREFQFTVEEEGQITNPSTIRLENCILKVTRA